MSTFAARLSISNPIWNGGAGPEEAMVNAAGLARADGKVLFLTNGNGPPGSTGRLLRSRDDGVTWEDAALPGELNSTPWCVATNAADPMLLFAVTNLGQLFRSDDGGETWRKLQREFGEVRSLLWRPTGALGTASEKIWSRDGRAW